MNRRTFSLAAATAPFAFVIHRNAPVQAQHAISSYLPEEAVFVGSLVITKTISDRAAETLTATINDGILEQSARWRADVLVRLGAWESIKDTIRSISGPSRFDAAHDLFQSGLRDLANGAADLADELRDGRKLTRDNGDRPLRLLNQGSDTLDEALESLLSA